MSSHTDNPTEQELSEAIGLCLERGQQLHDFVSGFRKLDSTTFHLVMINILTEPGAFDILARALLRAPAPKLETLPQAQRLAQKTMESAKRLQQIDMRERTLETHVLKRKRESEEPEAQ